jgi:hypothetical protein
MAQVVEYLPRKYEALSSNFSTVKEERKREKNVRSRDLGQEHSTKQNSPASATLAPDPGEESLLWWGNSTREHPSKLPKRCWQSTREHYSPHRLTAHMDK